ASRRKQAVCLKSVKEDAMSSVGSDNNVGEDCFGNNQLSSTNRCHDFEDLVREIIYMDEGILYPCDEDVAREETVDNVQWEETVDNSNGDDNIEAEEMCGENSKANTNVVHLKVMIS
ncbi:hypothetical protein WUBG_15772, partial [Wuchereria bancrofti]